MANEQESKGGLPLTSSNFEGPFDTAITRYGVEGLNITDAVDVVKPNEMTRMLNVTHRVDGAITARPGLTQVNVGGTNHHSIKLLDGHGAISLNSIHGIDTDVYEGQSGVLTSVDSGFSGEPLSMVTHHPPLNGVPWMYIGDTEKMIKVRGDGLVLPIGLPAVGIIATTELDKENKTPLANFNDDGTGAASWTATHGKTIPDAITGTIVDTINPLIAVSSITPPDGSPAVAFALGLPQLTVVGQGATQDFWNLFGVQVNRSLNSVGMIPMTDDDYIHLWLRFNNTAAIKEIRIYFVVTSTFDPTILPGAPPTSGIVVFNADAYWTSIQPPDVSGALNALRNIDDAVITANLGLLDSANNDLNAALINPGLVSRGLVPALTAAGNKKISQLTPVPVLPTGPGSGTWTEYASVGYPLRRGDFQRIGTNPACDWGTISGIILYVVGSKGTGFTGAGFQLANMYATGGSGPDSGEATSSPYDYVYTHYDTLTGAEGNPQSGLVGLETELTTSAKIDALRRSIVVHTGESFGNAHTVQRFYRRGGTLPTDWFFVGQNASDGADFIDTVSDTDAAAAGSVEINNNQPVATVTADGVTVLNQPLSSIWGPVGGESDSALIMGCGDPYRPGFIYFCKPGNPESWPPENVKEVCSPSEQLLQGIVYGGQAYVFSQLQMYALYPNLSGETTGVTVLDTQCKKGIVNGCRWGAVTGIGGIIFVANDGIYRTTGGPPEWLSKKIDPLFRGQTKNSLAPIDFSHPEMLRLEIYQNELWFLYQDQSGNPQVLIYSLVYNFWRQYQFATPISSLYAVEGSTTNVLQIGAKTTGKGFEHSGTSDDGAAIACTVRNGAIFFDHPREEKRLGDQILDFDPQEASLTLQNFYNTETVTDDVIDLPVAAARSRTIVEAFGVTPKRATNISTEIRWSSATAVPALYYLGTSAIIEPDITANRVTQWDDLQSGDEVYLSGITFDVDTGADDRVVVIEVDYLGAISTAATLTVNADGRHKLKFSWPAIQANKVRIRPADPDCTFWILYKANWIFQPEPPRISKWDSYFENGWDQYYTGLDLYCNTFGINKTIEVYADGVLIKTETVNTIGRLVHHITLPWGRAHVFHFIATDNNDGMLYGHRWQLEAEPSEQANWNQNFTVEGTEAGKYLKALVFQTDTFGLDKTVTVECDGVVVETLTINTSGRKVVQKAFPRHLGNVFRIYPTDSNPSRLYSTWFVFDSEPLALDRWETQETDHRLSGWHYPIYGQITIRSVTDINLQVLAYNQTGVVTTKNYTIPSTGGLKQKCFVPFQAVKGVLFRYIAISADPFFLYREESTIAVRVWGSNATELAHPFGNDDTDPTRVMTKASLAAARGGGGTG